MGISLRARYPLRHETAVDENRSHLGLISMNERTPSNLFPRQMEAYRLPGCEVSGTVTCERW